MNTMSNPFAAALQAQNSDSLVGNTENGAVGFVGTKSKLLDFFFHAGSMRNWANVQIATDFAEAYAEDPLNALVCLFFVRDCRGGMGEKRVFSVCFDWLVRNNPEKAIALTSLIPEYGSWKTFFGLTDSFRKDPSVEKKAISLVREKIIEDIATAEKFNKCSLMAKWMPSENTSSKNTRRLATWWRNNFGISSKDYRKTLSKLRKCIDIVEADMSSGNWSEIDYNTVPSKAGMIYRKAFSRHDAERRQAWLDALKNGDPSAKINTSSLTVADMVHHYVSRFCNLGWRVKNIKEDPTIEAAWSKMVKEAQLGENVPDMLPIVDGSGSMYAQISPNSEVMAIDVSIGLGLFLANINKGSWKGMLIEYGDNPQFFRVPTEASLLEQVKIALKHDDCGSTNIEAVYDLILRTAIHDHIPQDKIPQLVQFSDMEFNCAMVSLWRDDKNREQTLFENIHQKYTDAGYLLPKLYFWNINSRTNIVPLQQNENGVGLLSGYSQSIMDMVLSRKFDPLEILLERLGSKRYDPIREALK